ncbi:MAG: hypothetical protein A2452_06605 [Candidatus Firestonebacteria bacterium RIFOXYC2_FULL_39_67]|nr:MAG: hypothetical protein A2452_06605 [Candidatus Firestonebacteria bacterium RIFOXYC2_FULL_39_67]
MHSNEVTLGYHILFYFFLSGTAGGAFIWSTLLTLFSTEKKLDKLVLYEAIASLLCLGVGALALFTDLGHMERAWRLGMIPLLNPTSAVAWGSVFIPAHFCMLVLYIYSLITKKARLARIVSYAGLLIATMLVTYTGFLLSVCKGFPLWNSAILVPVFFASACLSGLGFLFLIGFGFKILSAEDNLVVLLRKVLLLLIIIDGFVFTDYYVLYTGFVEAHEVAKYILLGPLAFLFWVGEVFLGFLAPIAILISPLGKTKRGLVIASVLAVLGVFVMRYIIVIGGQMISVSR